MRFSIYSEMQYWGDRPREQLYEEVLEQIINADRLGFDAYALIEHFFFDRFSISADPLQVFAAVAPRTRQIKFRTLLHVLPYHNPTVLASRIGVAEVMLGGRYEFGFGRGHAWVAEKAGLPIEQTRARYDEALEVLLAALGDERFSHDGDAFKIVDSHITPRPTRPMRIFAGGTSDSTYERAGELGWSVVVPPLLPYVALAKQLDIYRSSCARHGHEPDIVWIHACYLDADRDTALREAELGMRRFLEGNASVLLTGELPGAEKLNAAGYGFYASGIMEELAKTPYEKMIADDVVWVGTPKDVIERIEAVRGVCEGLTEISITCNCGGFAHWQAIKAQELFAAEVMPAFREPPAREHPVAGAFD